MIAQAAQNKFGAPQSRQRRGGLSTIEFMGCVMAVFGGLYIGALYLGVNLEHVAHDTLDRANVLEKIPEKWRPESAKDQLVGHEHMDSLVRTELAAIRNDIQALHDETLPMSKPTAHAGATSTGLDKTRAYWLRLNEIARRDGELQRDADTSAGGTNTAKVFAVKARVSRVAAKGITAAPTDEVDASIVKFGRQLSLWYDRTAEIYERAVRIWETTSSPQAREQLIAEWKRDEIQHRHETRLIRDKATAVRAAISRHFGEEFPAFASPETTENTGSPSPADAAAR
jgi:hypothetical protein